MTTFISNKGTVRFLQIIGLNECKINDIFKQFFLKTNVSLTANLNIHFITSCRSREFTKTYKNTDHFSDVLTFPHTEKTFGKDAKFRYENESVQKELFLGDILICLPVLFRKHSYKRFSLVNHSFSRSRGRFTLFRIKRLFAHSYCHLIGFDHRNKRESHEMNCKEIELLKSIVNL